MSFLSPKELQRYHLALARSAGVRSHRHMLDWLQGDVQHYLAHDMMLAAWGDFRDWSRALQHDVLSVDARIRTQSLRPAELCPLLRSMFIRWCQVNQSPFVCPAADGDRDWIIQGSLWSSALEQPACTTPSMLVHGMTDKRNGQDCLYMAVRLKGGFDRADQDIMLTLTPVMDIALRQVNLLPTPTPIPLVPTDSVVMHQTGIIHTLSRRELEILHWVAEGKTNAEIGLILNLSGFTVKNHLKRMFSKLNVSNRAQAVGKLQDDNTAS